MKRESFRRCRCALITAAVMLLAASPALASHTTFLFQVDRFEVAGGCPNGDGVDEFDDGVLDPWGSFGFGTANEADGVVTLSSPGFDSFSFYPFLGLVLDRSDIFAPALFGCNDGLGDFSGTSTWVPIIPHEPAGFFGQVFSYQVGDELWARSAAIANLSAETAEALGLPPGLIVLQNRVRQRQSSDVWTVLSYEAEGASINEGDITGSFVIRQFYDDTTDLVHAQFSVDGGATFFEPLPPQETNLSAAPDGAMSWELIADPPSKAYPSSADQQTCVNAMNKAGAAVAKAQNKKVSEACLKSASKGDTAKLGTPPQAQTAQACLTNDVKGLVAKAAKKMGDGETKKCLAEGSQMPSYAYEPSADIATAASSEGVAMVEDLFGADLDAAVVAESADKSGAKCQGAMLKTTDKIFDALWKIALKAKKSALKDELAVAGNAGLLENRIMKAVQADLDNPSGKVPKLIGKKPELCFDASVTTPLASMLPGKCASSADSAALAACSGVIAKCRFCRSLNAFDGMSVDCDDFDDGADDGSCD